MSDARAAGILAAADELQRRDDAVAAEIAELDELASTAAAVRSNALEVRDALAAVPVEAAAVEHSLGEARERASDAHAELAEATHRLAGLEAARRRREDDVLQARRRVSTATEAVADTRSRVDRLLAKRLEVRDEERALRDSADALNVEAHAVAERIRSVPGVMDAGKGVPGTSLDSIDDWAARARAALFVARGTVEIERERIVHEASALLGSVLGEAPAGTSVALARRRLEEALT